MKNFEELYDKQEDVTYTKVINTLELLSGGKSATHFYELHAENHDWCEQGCFILKDEITQDQR